MCFSTVLMCFHSTYVNITVHVRYYHTVRLATLVVCAARLHPASSSAPTSRELGVHLSYLFANSLVSIFWRCRHAPHRRRSNIINSNSSSRIVSIPLLPTNPIPAARVFVFFSPRFSPEYGKVFLGAKPQGINKFIHYNRNNKEKGDESIFLSAFNHSYNV